MASGPIAEIPRDTQCVDFEEGRVRQQVIVIALAAGLLSSLASAQISLGTHAVRGVVKAVSTTSLVIAPSRRRPRDMSFAINPSTERDGSVTVGSYVSIRYVMQGSTLVATAIALDAGACRPGPP